MNTNRLFSLLSLIVVAALALGACAAPATSIAPSATAEAPQATPEISTPPVEPTPQATQAADFKIVVLTFVQELDNLNPLYTSMYFSAITREFWLRGLWNFDDANTPVLQLAAEFPTEANGGLSDGGQTLTVKLRDDMVWSDGQPLTADDFVFTYDMIMNDKNTVLSRYPYKEFVDSVAAADTHTLVIKFNKPFAPWPTTIFTNVNGTSILPKHILEPVFQKEGTLDKAEWNRAPTVGIGPFVFKEWESGSHIIFEKNPTWVGPAPKIDQIFIRIVPDDAAQEAAIKAGDTDFGVFLDYSQVAGINDSGTAKVATVLSGYDEGLFLNVDPKTAHPAMLDVNVRKAIALAINREKITQDLLLGLTTPAATFWDSTPPYGDPTLKPYPYDPEEAKKLLEAAGWKDADGDGIREKDGKKLELRYITNERQLRKDVQAVAEQMLHEVGIAVKLENHSSDVFWNSFGDSGPQATGQYDIAEYSSVGSFPDPDASNYWLCSQIPSADNPEGANWQGYCNESLDKLLTDQATTVDPKTRQQLYAQIEKTMYDEVLWIGMWKDPDLWSINNRLGGVRLSGATPFWNVTDWDVKP